MALFTPTALHSEGPLKTTQSEINCQAAAIYHGWPEKWVIWKQDRELLGRLAVLCSLWAHWKELFAISCSEALHKNKERESSMTVPLEKFFCSHMMQLQELNRVWGMIMIPLCYQQSKPTARCRFCFNLSVTFKNYLCSASLLSQGWKDIHCLM